MTNLKSQFFYLSLFLALSGCLKIRETGTTTEISEKTVSESDGTFSVDIFNSHDSDEKQVDGIAVSNLVGIDPLVAPEIFPLKNVCGSSFPISILPNEQCKQEFRKLPLLSDTAISVNKITVRGSGDPQLLVKRYNLPESEKCNPIVSTSNFADRVLAIRSTDIVDDATLVGANGPFSFGFLMSQMAPEGENPSNFVKDWLNQFATVTSVNGNSVTPRFPSALLNAWPKISGTNDLDMTKAPLRLLAITARLDLRNQNRAGEGRFIFGVLDSNGSRSQFTVILEYNLPFQSGLSQKDWALAWYNLSRISDLARRKNYLKSLTALFSQRKYSGIADFTNGNAISQVRTNEIEMGPFWELREFRLDSATKKLVQVTAKQTPDISFNPDPSNSSQDPRRTQKWITWVNQNQAAILAGTHVVPEKLEDGTPFLAASTPVVSADMQWGRSSSIPANVRKAFSINTCNGCHGGETGTQFLHVSTRNPGVQATLSRFMTGPKNDGTPGDLEVRAQDLKNLLIAGFCN